MKSLMGKLINCCAAMFNAYLASQVVEINGFIVPINGEVGYYEA